MRFAEASNALVIRDQGAVKLDCGGNEQPIRGITVLETVELIAARGCMMAQWHRRDAGTIEEALDPGFNGNVQINPPGVDEQRYLPGGDGAQVNGSAASPAVIGQSTGRRTRALVAAVKPQRDVGVEQERIRHDSISRLLSASDSTSSARADTLLQQAPHGQSDRFSLVADGQPFGRFFN